jgi:hypothetical protein
MSSIGLPGWKRGAVAVLFATAFLTFSSAAADAQDNDADGIDDGLEASLAAQFFPYLHYDPADGCLAPLSRPVLFRARYLSFQGAVHTNYLGINYVNLYNADCGFNFPYPGTGAHTGDNEAFMVVLFRDNTGQWLFDGVSGTAHDNTVCEYRSYSYQNELWVASAKHGHYASEGQCDGQCYFLQSCANPGTGLSHVLYNVGEPWAPLVDDLGAVYEAWSGQYAWSGAQFFGAGIIRQQLFTDRFTIPTPPPESQGCYDDCSATAEACEISCDNDNECRRECQLQHQDCNTWCFGAYKWDST